MSWYQYRGEWIQARPLEPPNCWGSEPVCEDEFDYKEDDVMDLPDLIFDVDTHTYTLDGEVLPSVTQLTDIYSSVSIQEGDLMELTMEAAAERGTVMHAYLEHRVWGGTQEEFELPSSCEGYADSVELFLSEHTVSPYLTETPMWGELGGVKFAGTPDFVGLFDGVRSILDWKFVSQVQKTKVGAQLNGYLLICENNDWILDKLFCVQFLPDGTYRLYSATSQSGSFSLCLSVWYEKYKKHPKGAIS